VNQAALNWLGLLEDDFNKFSQNLSNCSVVQEELLLRNIRKNSLTEYGLKHGFPNIKGYTGFRENVPIVNFEDLQPFINSISEGSKNILTKDEVLRFEETSGSTGGNKLIPLTSGLTEDFHRGIGAWMHSLKTSCPNVFDHRFYLAISPKLMNIHSYSSQVPVGSGDDLSYFNQDAAAALAPSLILPDTSGSANSEQFYKTTLTAMLEEKVSLISCWSPTYLLQMDSILRKFHKEFGVKSDFTWSELWPELAVVSCWTDASSAMFINELQEKLGSTDIQGKGLMSTESICSIPWFESVDPVLSYTSHFYEFEDENGRIYTASELIEGKEYAIIVTTSGGLYRYRSGDEVEVTGYCGSTPSFRFKGRGRVSDIAGEKLSESQVNEAFSQMKLPPSFLVAGKSRYLLVSSSELADAHCTELDNLLKANCYYEQARTLGQLKSITFKKLPGDFIQHLTKKKNQRGTRDATVKFDTLIQREEAVVLFNDYID
jgi:hypothetical protein